MTQTSPQQSSFTIVEKIPKLSNEEHEVYNGLVQCSCLDFVQLGTVNLDGCSFSHTPCELRPLLATTFGCLAESGVLIVASHIEIELCRSEDEERIFSCNLDHFLGYSFEGCQIGLEEVPAKALHAFVMVHGPTHVWPYAREFVQSLAGRAGFPGVILPLRIPRKSTKRVRRSDQMEKPEQDQQDKDQ